MKFCLTLPGGGLFGGGSPPSLPPPPPPLPTPEDPAVKQKADANRIAATRRQGLLATNLTSGVLADTEADTERKTLLGS